MVGDLHDLTCEVIIHIYIYTIYSAIFLCMGTLYCYEICYGDSVRLTLQYKAAKLHMTIDGLMGVYTKVKQTCMQSVVYCHLTVAVKWKLWC